MVYTSNYTYELTSEQFLHILKGENPNNDKLIDELVSDSSKLSAMQASQAQAQNIHKSLSLPSPYYSSIAFKSSITQVQHNLGINISDAAFVSPSFIIHGPVNIDGGYKYTHGMTFSNCTFKDDLIFRNYSEANYLHFNNCTFNGVVALTGIKAKMIQVNGIALSSINFVYSEAENTHISLKKFKTITIGDFKALNLSFYEMVGDEIHINSLKIDNFRLSKVDTNVLKIHQVRKLFIGEDSTSMQNATCKIGELQCYFNSESEDNYMKIDKIEVGNCTFTGSISSTTSIMKDVKISNSLNFNDFNCNGTVKFHNIILIKSIVNIINSDLGKFQLINMNLDNINYIKVVDSKISDINLSSCTAPLKIIGRNKKDHVGARDAIRQFKLAYSRSGDKIQEAILSPYEYDEHFKSLDTFSSWQSFSDKTILFFNKISNFYGHHIGVAFLFTLINFAFFYTGFCRSLGFVISVNSKTNVDEFIRIISFSLEFINPIHKPEYLIGNLLEVDNEHQIKISNSTRIWEGTSKVIVTYALYQFVQAFRKYGK